MSAFEQVQANGGINVVLAQGPAAVVVDADAETQARISTEIKGNALVVSWEQAGGRKGNRSGHGATVYVTCPRLTALTVGQGSNARSSTPLTADDFRVVANAGSRLDLEVKAGALDLTASSGSSVTLAGTATQSVFNFTSGTTCHAFALQAATVSVSATGGSTAEINANQSLTAQASGGSSIRYKGAAKMAGSKATGGGSVRHVE